MDNTSRRDLAIEKGIRVLRELADGTLEKGVEEIQESAIERLKDIYKQQFEDERKKFLLTSEQLEELANAIRDKISNSRTITLGKLHTAITDMQLKLRAVSDVKVVKRTLQTAAKQLDLSIQQTLEKFREDMAAFDKMSREKIAEMAGEVDQPDPLAG